MTPPLPLLDHAVIGLGTELDAGEACYRRLGFTLTPRGYHSLGSMNHLAVFGTDYLELLAAPAASPPWSSRPATPMPPSPRSPPPACRRHRHRRSPAR